MKKLVRLSAGQKETAKGNILVSTMKHSKRALSTVMSEIEKDAPIRKAYDKITEIKASARKQGLVKDMLKSFVISEIEKEKPSKENNKHIESLIIENKKIKDDKENKEKYNSNLLEIEKNNTDKEVYRFLTLLNDGTTGRNIVDNYYIFEGIHFDVVDGQSVFTLVRRVYLGNKKLVGKNNITMGTTGKDFLTDEDLCKELKERDMTTFEALLSQFNTDRKEFTSLDAYLSDSETIIEGYDKEFRGIKDTILKYYVAL